MVIGLYGGTFDPPHLGHLAAARTAVEVLGLDTLYLVPAGDPPHKDLPPEAPSRAQRLELVRLAAGYLGDRAQVLDVELRREGKSYTADTVEAFRAAHPDDTLWLLMGTDMFLSFHQWRDPERILSCAGIAAFGRTEADTEELFSAQRDRLFRAYPKARIFIMTVPDVIPVSSTELRARLARGEGGHLLPPAVYGRILLEGLYGAHADLRHLSLSDLRAVSMSMLKHRRIPHVLGVEQEAVRLAVRYGDGLVDLARRAALLHDCTKRLSPEEHLDLCRRHGVEMGPETRASPKLYHAVTGAVVARDVFGESGAVCDAIRWHTTGRAGMSTLEKIVCLADYIEPSRRFPGVEGLRAASDEDLDRALLLGLDGTVRELEERGETVHRATREARDALRDLLRG